MTVEATSDEADIPRHRRGLVLTAGRPGAGGLCVTTKARQRGSQSWASHGSCQCGWPRTRESAAAGPQDRRW
jgi:hypothetical protein